MKRYGSLIPLLLLAISLILPKGVRASPGHFTPPLSASDLIAEVNALRTANGLLPYQVNSILMSIAQTHAEYQASTGVVTHYGVDGSRPYQRAIAAGYPVAGDLSRGGFFSENIHSGVDLSALAVVNAWQGDFPHLNTMISADLKDIGVGIAVASGVTYYTLDAGLSTDSVLVPSSINTGSQADPFAAPTGTPSTTQPVLTSTPEEDGNIYHVVQANEALWSIALAYQTTIAELKKLNGLVTDEIFIGQKLVISKKEVSTPTPEPTITVTLGIPTSTATIPVTPSATSTATPVPLPPATKQNGTIIVASIVVIALLGAGVGALAGRRKLE